MTTVSIILPIYNRLDFLALILKALEKQTYQNFEVIVAEDNNDLSAQSFIAEYAATAKFVVRHTNQSDEGFRKNKSLNNALRVAAGELIIFLDGDCIPHKHLVKEYVKHIAAKKILFGRRVMLSQKLTERMLTNKFSPIPNLLKLLFYGSKKIENALYLPWLPIFTKKHHGFWGCNWGILKEHLMEVNGFDEDYIKAGYGEDVDIEWRLRKIGCELKSLKYKAVVYHLWHPENYSAADLAYNKQILNAKVKAGAASCKND